VLVYTLCVWTTKMPYLLLDRYYMHDKYRNDSALYRLLLRSKSYYKIINRGYRTFRSIVLSNSLQKFKSLLRTSLFKYRKEMHATKSLSLSFHTFIINILIPPNSQVMCTRTTREREGAPTVYSRVVNVFKGIQNQRHATAKQNLS
jgi:hypothetical protein